MMQMQNHPHKFSAPTLKKQNKTKQKNKTKQNKTKHKTKQNKTKQNKTQNKTKQNKTKNKTKTNKQNNFFSPWKMGQPNRKCPSSFYIVTGIP